MLLGSDRVLACPECGALARLLTVVSGNTMGAVRWTDGKMSAPMLPDVPRITRCGACGAFFWISEEIVVGRLEWGEGEGRPPAAWAEAPSARELTEAEYLQALDRGAAGSREQEVHLRVRAWWAANDAVRGPVRAPVRDPVRGGGTRRRSRALFEAPRTRSASATGNLERLVEILDPGVPEEQLLEAEALRELGRFDAAERLLEDQVPERCETVAAVIRRLARAGDPAVRRIPD